MVAKSKTKNRGDHLSELMQGRLFRIGYVDWLLMLLWATTSFCDCVLTINCNNSIVAKHRGIVVPLLE